MRSIHVICLLACVACRSSAPDTGQPGTPGDTSAAVTGQQPATDSGATEVELRIDGTSFAPGAQVALTVINHADATMAFNPCTRTVERDANGTWMPVEEPGRVCTMEAWLLEPHASRSANTELPSSLTAGRYRLVIALTREGGAPGAAPGTPPASGDRVRAVSAPFTVTR